MGKLSLLVSMLMVCCWTVEIYATDVETAWQKYQAEFPIGIQTKSELGLRKSIFSETHAKIEMHNSDKDATFEMGHNQFSVMTEEEKRSFFGAMLPVAPFNVTSLASTRQVATAVDYRTNACMSPIRNQGSCGSCWTFSATAVVEFQRCRKNGRIRVDLSEQQLVDCSRDNGCSGGWEHEAWEFLASNGGQALESSYPYKATVGTCAFQNGDSAGAQISSSSAVQWVESEDTNTMMSILTGGRILSIYMQLPNSFMNYKSGIFYDTSCVANNAHAMNVVGYGTLNSVAYWVVRNSWGSYWGASGYILVRRGVDLCMIESFARTTNVL